MFDDRPASLGASVRHLRRQRGLTLKALGRRAGLSHPFLSQLERGLACPSVRSVERIAAALEVPVGSLWHGAPRPLRTREWSGGRDWAEGEAAGPGTVLVYVARGAVELDVGGTVRALREGEAFQFDGSRGHRIRRTGGPRTRVLYVTA